MATLDTVSARPSGASHAAGKAYFETSTNKFIVWNGSQWIELHSDGTGSAFSNTYSLELDGVDDYAATLSDMTLTSTNKSVSGWFKISDLNGQNTVWGNPNGYQTSFIFWYAAGGTIFFRTSKGNNSLSLGSSFGSDWFHLAVTGDGTDLKMYYNGSLAATAPNKDGDWYVRDFFKTGTTGTINPTYFYDGSVDEIAIWDGATLSASDIATIANAGAESGSKAIDLEDYTGLTNWWRMGDSNAGTGTTITDVVGGNNLTLAHAIPFIPETP